MTDVTRFSEPRAGDPDTLQLELDEYGSPVALEPGAWYVCFVPGLVKQWWHRLVHRGDVLHVRESIPGQGSQVRGWMTCAALTSYLLGRRYWVWTPHGLYQRLLREPNVCRVDVSRLVSLSAAGLAQASEVIKACDECKPGAPKHQPGAPKPFCMNCGRDVA